MKYLFGYADFHIHIQKLDKVNEIPGQKFEGSRYVKSVADMHNNDHEDWKVLINSL